MEEEEDDLIPVKDLNFAGDPELVRKKIYKYVCAKNLESFILRFRMRPAASASPLAPTLSMSSTSRGPSSPNLAGETWRTGKRIKKNA